MMSRRRLAVLVAIMAALAGAPSSVSAAAPNELSQATVLPATGDTATLFVVTARYRSPAGNPAIAVTATVGGQKVVLTLISGTTTDGTWSTATTAPPGTWTVTVHAAVTNGPQPTVSAGTISVATATAAPSPPEGASSLDPGPNDDSSASTPAPARAGTSPADEPASEAPQRSRAVAEPSQPPTGQASAGAAVRPGRGAGAPARTTRPEPAGSDDGTLRSPVASPSPAEAPAPIGGDDDLGLFMIIGTLAVGAVALVGSAWIFVAGRRERRAATVAAQPAAPTDPGVIAAAIVEQRALRRARLRSSDDPILAAMGLPDEDPAPTTPPVTRRHRGGRARRRRPPPA